MQVKVEVDDDGPDAVKLEDDDYMQSPNVSKNGNVAKTPCKAKRSLLNGVPRTPTPFKNALAEMGKRRSDM